MEEAGDGVDLLEYHMCSSGSCGFVYRGPYKSATQCPRPGCGAQRYDGNGNPHRRLYYSKITPWIHRLFADGDLAKFMQWHSDRSLSGQLDNDNYIVCDVYDGLLWREVFAKDAVIQQSVALDPVAQINMPECGTCFVQ